MKKRCDWDFATKFQENNPDWFVYSFQLSHAFVAMPCHKISHQRIFFVRGVSGFQKLGGQEFKFSVVFLIDLSYKPASPFDYLHS